MSISTGGIVGFVLGIFGAYITCILFIHYAKRDQLYAERSRPRQSYGGEITLPEWWKQVRITWAVEELSKVRTEKGQREFAVEMDLEAGGMLSGLLLLILSVCSTF